MEDDGGHVEGLRIAVYRMIGVAAARTMGYGRRV
jgi:hypothetical protein